MLFSSEQGKGTLKTIILKALKSHPRMYSYELAQHVKEQTEHTIHLNDGDLYPILRSLEAQGLVTSETESIGKRLRKYYSCSHPGTTVNSKKTTEINDFLGNRKFFFCKKPQTISPCLYSPTVECLLCLGVPLWVGLSAISPRCWHSSGLAAAIPHAIVPLNRTLVISIISCFHKNQLL